MLFIEFSIDNKNRAIMLKKGEYFVGRDKSNDIIIKNSSVSRKHLKVYYLNDNWYIEDLGSSNGTIILNTPVNEPYCIKDNDTGLLGGDIEISFKLNGNSNCESSDIPIELDLHVEKTRDSNIITRIKKEITQILSISSEKKMIDKINAYSKTIGILSYGIFKSKKHGIDIIFSSNKIPKEVKHYKIYKKHESLDKNLIIEPLTGENNNVFYYILYNKVFINDEIIDKFKVIMKIIYFHEERDNTLLKQFSITNKYNNKVNDFIAVSDKMKKIIIKAIKYASLGQHILITGELGTGKELIAELIKKESPRKKAPSETTFLAGLEVGIIDSELFGHKKGSFTGAIANHTGVFERNNGGIIFIDEISLLPLRVQEKLLRTVEYGDIYPIGGLPKKVDVQIIFATNANLNKLIKSGKFRKDLYYRISAMEINIPPLRERKEDIIPIFEYYLKKYCETIGRKYSGIEDEVREMLLNYPWEGNIRELKNVTLLTSTNIKNGKKIKINDLPESLIKFFAEDKTNAFDEETLLNIKKELQIKEIEMIKKALKLTNGNKSKAAKVLGISRSGFMKKLKQLFDEENLNL
jgi:transcriptional regulator with PAS, ATPase and Fis domain